MWNWDQGRLDYFQFDNLRKIAKFALKNDIRAAAHAMLVSIVGLPFSPNSMGYKPWRNYSRTFKSMGLVYFDGKVAQPTSVSKLLADDGSISTDEYFHFLAQFTSSPSPALIGWDNTAKLRYPLLFALKFLLARAALGMNTTKISEIVAAYDTSGFSGDEDHGEFEKLVNTWPDTTGQFRQSAESIRVIAQISYLSLRKNTLTVSLSIDDARDIFLQLSPIMGTPLKNGDAEIRRRTDLFQSAIAALELDYGSTAVSDVEEAGFSAALTFAEGQKSRKTHLVIERNGKIRTEYFKAHPSPVCAFYCEDTSKLYPWTPRILDIHHLLPLCSGARTSKNGTLLDDLVAICPTCHRGVHRYYDIWLKKAAQKDFSDAEQARLVYEEAKDQYGVV